MAKCTSCDNKIFQKTKSPAHAGLFFTPGINEFCKPDTRKLYLRDYATISELKEYTYYGQNRNQYSNWQPAAK
jgi:hypothetical protein